MKAVIRTGLLGTNLSFLQDYPTPSITNTQKNHVYIKVKAASINPVDYKLPKVIGGKGVGIDFCGTIIEKINIIDNDDDDDDDEHNKNNTKKFEIGDDVFGTCSLLSSSSGSLAEYCIADIDKIAKVPKKNNNNDDNNHNHNTWSYLECAALPVAYMSALQSLRIGKITPTETSINTSSDDDDDNNNNDDNSQKAVLVIGASGGCGIAGIQLCKAMGIGRIVGICSDRNIDFVKELGATEVVSYSNDTELQSFFDKNSGTFDCVYDAATNSGGGEDYWSMSQKLLKKGDDEKKIHGEYVALNGPASKWIRAFAGRQKAHESIIMVKSNSSDLELVLSLLNKIKAKPIINVVQFSEKGLEDAFKQLKSRRTKGKIVFEVY